MALNGALSALIPSPRNASVATRQLGGSAVQLVSQISILAAVWVAGRHLDKRPFRDFGLHVDRGWWADLGFGLALGAVLMTAIFVVEWAAGWVRVTDSLVTREGGLPFWPGIVMPLIGYVVFGIAEELLSRGYHPANLAEGFEGRRMGPVAAIALATLIRSRS